ncbi:MAG TPA: hypothetical protein IAC37_00745 [Candidatus Ventrimonas merdavium]|nr:hypothetical protein [Candidatus Ventrimonas merdavium]
MKSKKVLAGMGLGAMALVGGTFAYFSQTLTLDNPLSTGSYSTTLKEDFTPPTEDLKPGAHWDKEVGATNTGDYPVLVRIKMDEKWVRKGESDAYVERSSRTTAGQSSTIFNSAQLQDDGSYDATQVNDNDGLTPNDNSGEHSVIFKKLELSGDGSDSQWVDGGDGYWYWNGVLEKGNTTTNLLTGLEVATDIDLGKYLEKEYYQISDEEPDYADTEAGMAEKGWTAINTLTDLNGDGKVDIYDLVKKLEDDDTLIEDGESVYRAHLSYLDADAKGYADSNYTLTVTAEFVQATKDAVSETWEINVDKYLTNCLTNIKADAVANGSSTINLINK